MATNEVFVCRFLVNVSSGIVDELRIGEVSVQCLVKAAKEACARLQRESYYVRII